MNTNITQDFQIKLIAFGLLVIIPVTIDLGLKFIFPKTDWQTYQKLENEYIKKNMPNYDQYKKINDDHDFSKKELKLISIHTEYVEKWEKSEQYKNLKKEDKKNNSYHFATLCFLIIAIILTLIFIHIPIINAATTFSALFLVTQIFELDIKGSFLSIPLGILDITTYLICLLIILYVVYKNNN